MTLEVEEKQLIKFSSSQLCRIAKQNLLRDLKFIIVTTLL